MITTPSATDVRRLVVEQLRRLGGPVRDDGLLETILISDGHYRGRSYRTNRLMATWFVELGLVQFYNAEGEMLGSFSLGERPTPQAKKKMAA